MKQTLSVADFATILELVNMEIGKIERFLEECEKDKEKFGLKKQSHSFFLGKQRYQDLQHLKQSLQNLNVEVETPKVGVETNEP